MAEALGPPRSTSVVRAVLASLRPRQWTKNLFVLSPLLFSRHYTEWSALVSAVAGFLAFSLISSSVYLINDVIDAERDRQHPTKRLRPIASGLVSPALALSVAALLALLSLAGSAVVTPLLAVVTGIYLLLNVLYSILLKRVVIIDVMSIAASFVLRILAGAVVVRVPVSEWLLICTSLLALFLGFSKRRHEVSLLAEGAKEHRSVLREYSPYFLDQMISLVTASTLICYILYTLAEETVVKYGTKNLILTIPFVLYGLFRYLYLIHQRHTGGDPTSEFLTDIPLLVTVFLWGLSIVLIISFPLPDLGRLLP